MNLIPLVLLIGFSTLCTCDTLGAAGTRAGMYVGTAVEPSYIKSDTTYEYILRTQFNMLVAENVCKFGYVEPQQNVFTYTDCDYLFNYAIKNNMTFRGHNFIWGSQNPSWVNSLSASQKPGVITNHIKNVGAHYNSLSGSHAYAWDVVNEAVADNGSGLKSTVWYPDVGNYIDLSFQTARSAAPTAKLFYNDYGAEGSGTKSDYIYNMVSSMKSRGIPIDGVGLQMHVSTSYTPSESSILTNIKRLAALGLEVHITEMDVSTNGASDSNTLNYQATIYKNVLDACMQVSNCKAFLSWGFTDKYTWLGSSNYPLEYTSSYGIKPAYNSLLARLQQGR